MTKEPITFDKLPQAVSYLTEQVEKIYQLVETLQPQRLDYQHQLIDIDKASILIQKSKPTIYRLARTGLIPTYKRGKKLYFYEDVHIPADTRSAFPVISVHSPVSIQCRWQS